MFLHNLSTQTKKSLKITAYNKQKQTKGNKIASNPPKSLRVRQPSLAVMLKISFHNRLRERECFHQEKRRLKKEKGRDTGREQDFSSSFFLLNYTPNPILILF